MNYKIFCTVCSFIYFNKMITTTKCSKRTLQSLSILKLSVACKTGQIKSLLAAFPHIHTRRNKMCSLINLLKINICFSKINRIHATSDINSHYIRNCFISYCHCGSNSTSLTGMNIRHDTNPCAFCHWIIAHTSYLLYSFILYYSCIAYGCIYFSFNFN